MIANIRPYSAMKDSGVPWLMDVPEHWEVRRFKHVLRERNARSCEGREQLLRVSQFTGVTERKRADGGDEADTRAESLVGYKVVEPYDLVVNIMLAWNGSMGVSPFAGIASPAYCVYRFGAGAQPWYFHHLLRSPAYKARIRAISTGVVESRLRLYTDDLYRLEALVPPLPEQVAIVRFLNYAERRIRRYIRAKQRLMKMLEEQKEAIIHRAVTRGLDRNVRLKTSGVEGLGQLPEHWEIFQLRRLVRRGRRITYGIVQPGEPDASGRFMIRGQDYSFGWASPENIFRVSDAVEAPYKRSRLSTGDLVLTIVGAGVGNVAIVPDWLDESNITRKQRRESRSTRKRRCRSSSPLRSRVPSVGVP
jgi:restriction endonuclease S subunit